jgi:4-amino-4-deoxy-L-arabinose transferase-like glycosyltransferase
MALGQASLHRILSPASERGPSSQGLLPSHAEQFEAQSGLNAQPRMARAPARQHIPYLIFTLFASLYLLPFMRLLLQPPPEGLLVYGAVRIVHGQVFARDFFEVVGPGTFYWLALFFKLFGVTFVATRICLFVTSLGTGLAMYFLSRRICRQYQVLPCILLAGTYFGTLWPTISHHVDSNCFALLSVACMTVWQGRRKDGLLFAAGALAGATTCFLQQKGLLLLLALLLWLWVQRRRRSTSLSSLGAVTGGYISVVGLMLVYFWSRHALWDLFYANVVWPSGHYSAVNVVPYAQGMIRDCWDHFVIAKSGFHWTIVTAAVLITPFLFVAALPALLPALAARYRRNALRPEILLYWLCGGALWLSEIHRKDIWHLVFGSPLLIILCIYYLQQYRAKVADLALQVLAISAACLAGFNLFLALSARPLATRVGTVAVFKNVPALALLDDKVAPGEEIFAYPYCPIYYFLSATTNPTRYGGLVYNFNTPSQFEEVVRVLEQRRVRYVLWDTHFQAKEVAALLPASARMPRAALIIEPYLESHYKVVWEDADTRLMEREGEGHAD